MPSLVRTNSRLAGHGFDLCLGKQTSAVKQKRRKKLPHRHCGISPTPTVMGQGRAVLNLSAVLYPGGIGVGLVSRLQKTYFG